MLPRYGFASEDVPHIARLLFRVGGQRGPDTLLDKFQTVIGEMGIELVYSFDGTQGTDTGHEPTGDASTLDAQTPQALRDDFLLAPPASHIAASSSPSPMHYAPHRRRNSDSIALALGMNGNGPFNGNGNAIETAPRVTRAHSTVGLMPPEPQRKEVRFSDVVDSLSVSDITWDRDETGGSTFENIPFRPRTDVPDDPSEGPNGFVQAGMGSPQDEDRPSTRADNRPPLDFSHFGDPEQGFGSHLTEPLNGGVLPEEELSSVSVDLGALGEDEATDEPSLPIYPVGNLDVPNTPGPASDSTSEHNDLRHTDYSSQLPFRDARDEDEMEAEQVAFIASREQMFRMSSFNHWRDVARHNRSYNIRVQAHAESWDAWETIGWALSTWIDSALTMHVDENDGIQAYQDHMRQRELERRREDANRNTASYVPVPPTPPGLSRGSVNPHVRQSIERSKESLASAGRSPSNVRSTGGQSRQQSQSVERTLIEDLPLRPAAGRGSGDSRMRGPLGSAWTPSIALEDNDNLYDASEEELESEDLETSEDAGYSQYQVAAAAWSYFLLSKAFSHWADRADEEVERTQVARRHILRKKCYHALVGDQQRDETEAESKAIWFGQMVVMRQWRDTAVVTANNSRAMRLMAVRKQRRNAAEDAFLNWYHESKLRLAGQIDAQRLQLDCLQHWEAESQWLTSAHDEAEGIFKGSMLGRYMRHWKGEAQIQQRAEAGAGPIIARRDELLRSGLSLAWRQEAEETKNRERVAVIQELSDWTKHWTYETRLVQWQEEQDAEELDSAAYHWYLEWRLSLAERVIAQQERARFFERWVDATRASSARSYHLRHLARDVRHHDTITGFFNSGLEALEQLEMQAYQARGLIVQRVVPRVVRKWKTQLSHHHRMNNWSRLSNYFPIGETIIPHWQRVRRQEWQRRMQRLYNDFKYRVRTEAVKNCLDIWRVGTANAVTQGWEADDMRGEDDNAMVHDVVDAWRSKLEFVAFTGEVAEDADKETHLIQWHSLLEVHTENRLDAEEFDYSQTVGAYWDEWTLASVALRGREQTVREFTGHNARRDARHFLANWASQTEAVGDRVPEMDFRATRRSSRWATPAPVRTRLMTDMTPFRTPARPTFRQSTTTPAYRPPSEMTFPERDEDDGEG